MPITHSTVVVVADDGTSPVGSDEWNAAHSVPAHSELGSIGTDDHHAKSHIHSGDGSGTVDHGALSGLTDDDHTIYLKEKASGGAASEIPLHDHSGSTEAGAIAHGDLSDLTTGDPHTQYRLESADHTHENSGAQAGKLDHGLALNGLSDDDHPQYTLWTAIQASHLANEVMNFPSIESADDTQPWWWSEADANATLTEVDIAGEAITETYERGLKVVVATANSYAYQRYTYADQQRVKSGRKLSAIFAVWSVSSVNARIRLITSASTTVVSSTTSTAGWTILTAENLTLDGTYVDIRLEVDVGTAYFVPLGINIGSRAFPLPPRGTQLRSATTTVVKYLTGLGDEVTWTDVDCTSASSPLAVSVLLMCRMFDSTAGYDWILAVRINGSSEAFGASTNAVLRVGNTSNLASTAYNSFEFPVDDQQIFEYYLDRNAGTPNTLPAGAISLRGYREWA